MGERRIKGHVGVGPKASGIALVATPDTVTSS
jgi:hypothetical protein